MVPRTCFGLVSIYFVVVSLILAIESAVDTNNFSEDPLHRNRRQTSGKLCGPLRSPNTIVTCVLDGKDVDCKSNVKPGTIAKAKCKRYYKPSSKPHYSRLTCLNNGTWDQTLFYCNPECGESNIGRNFDRIIDGKQTEAGAFPWNAALYFREIKKGAVTWKQKCSGSLITDQFVITVAHCVADTEKTDLRVALGKYYRDWEKTENGEVRRSVTNILYSPDYSKKTFNFDIALLRLNEKVEVGENIMPVCRGFPGASTYLDNKELYVVGWGLTREGDPTSASDVLLYNTVTVVNQNVCRKNGPSVYPTFDKFCTVKNNQSSVSIVQPGDSGGGITSVYDGLHVILGAVSAKENEYSMFTNFTWPYNVIWIENEMRKYDSTFRWDENDITVLQNNDRGCALPKASSSRKFCSLADGCEDCDVHDRFCFLPPGSKVDRVRVVCAPGYTIRSPYSGGDVVICMNGRSWYPEIPECHRYQYIPGNPMTKVTWQEARDNCAKNGHVLATIKNEEENKSFKEAAMNYFNATGIKLGAVWIGLNDIKFNNVYEWADGSILSKSEFNSWNKGEPSETGVRNYPRIYQEHCVQAMGECGRVEDCFHWKDNYCSELFYYFCKEIVPADGVFDRFSENIGDTSSTTLQRYTYLPGNPWRKVTWDTARDNCAAKGSQLAIIREEDQQQLFEKSVAEHFKDTETVPSGSTYNAWRGNWNNWIEGISFNKKCTEALAGDKLILGSKAKIYQWNLTDCEDLNYYFCSIKLL